MPQITTTKIPLMISGEPFDFTLAVTGIAGTKTFTKSGDLPNGISFATSGPNAGRFTETPDDDLSFFPIFEVYDNGVASGNPQQLYIKVVEPLDLTKILVLIMGDSQTNNSGIANPKTAGVKARLARWLPVDKYQIATMGYDGQEAPSVQSYYVVHGQPLFNALRPDNICIVETGINDIAFSAGLGASGIVARIQTFVNLLEDDGFKTIVQTVTAWDRDTKNETLRLAVNTAIRAMTADKITDVGGRTEFNSEAAAANLDYYNPDLLHLTSLGHKLSTYEYAKSIGELATELASCWDFLEESFLVGKDFTPLVVPFGRTGGETFEWFVNDVSVSTSETPTFNFATGGIKRIKCVITPSVGSPVELERSFYFANTGNVGGATLTPDYSEITEGGYVDLVAANLTSPIFRKRTGSGSLSNPDSNPLHRRYTDANPHAIAEIEAAEDMWGTVSLGSINSNQQWDMTGGGGTPSVDLKPRITGGGVEVDFVVPARNNADISTGSRFQFTQASTGYYWRLNLKEGKIISFVGSGENEKTLTYSEGQKVTFAFLVSGEVRVSVDGVYQKSFTDFVPNYSLYLYMQVYDDAGRFLWHRPDMRGENITYWKAAVAVVQPIAAPNADFTIPSTLKAGEVLEMTDESSNVTSFQYRMTNSKYADAPILTTPNGAPDLTRFLRIGNNEISRTGTNSGGSDTASDSVVVSADAIDAGNVTNYDLTNVPVGQKLVLNIEGVDTSNNAKTSAPVEITVA